MSGMVSSRILRRSVASLGVTAIVLASCSSGAPASPSEPPSVAAPSASASAAASAATLSGALRVDFLAYDAKMQPWLDQMKAEFNKLHPDVQLTLEIPNIDQYRDSLTTQAQGGNPPDVAQIATSWMPALADADLLADWEAAGYSKDLLGQMEPTLRDGARYQGKLTGLSYGASARAVFYNTAPWTKAGITTPPTTWDEFLDDLRKVKSSNAAKIPFYYEGKGQEAMAAWFPYVYFSYGGELADSSGKLTIDKDACVKGLTIYDTMNKEGLFEPNVTAGDFTGQRKAMSSGDASATITGPWLIGMYAEDKSTQKYDAFQIPKGTTQATVGVTDVYVQFKTTKNPAAANAFIEFLMDPARNLQFVKDRGFLPIYTSQFSLSDFQTGPTKAFTDALPNAKFIPLNANWVQFDKIGTNAVTAMYLEKSGPDKACQAMVDGLAGIQQ
jgi:multiple sugar transport system substrate-binding protein